MLSTVPDTIKISEGIGYSRCRYNIRTAGSPLSCRTLLAGTSARMVRLPLFNAATAFLCRAVPSIFLKSLKASVGLDLRTVCALLNSQSDPVFGRHAMRKIGRTAKTQTSKLDDLASVAAQYGPCAPYIMVLGRRPFWRSQRCLSQYSALFVQSLLRCHDLSSSPAVYTRGKERQGDVLIKTSASTRLTALFQDIDVCVRSHQPSLQKPSIHYVSNCLFC